ncbi:adenosyl-chloride synthase [bacterium BMS3Abin05]|nr:adenosyl-chloride synthase [bacterium BMS3Abin05]GBE28973.1 adenosyl-chloride synthase [bacterium BMS3Bbin03]HDK36381.1 hypothetical protein [Bacteroidota bacterium]
MKTTVDQAVQSKAGKLHEKPVLVLLTDFGSRDGYAGVMKGVVLQFAPHAEMVDLSHEIAPHAIDDASFVLLTSYKYFPKGTLFTVVVDPGVGTERKIIGVQTPDYGFLAPDNGVLGPIFAFEPVYKVYEITEKRLFLSNVSATFHGRDIFAPLSGRYLNGVTFPEMGREGASFHKGGIEHPVIRGDKISGKIIYRDHFGNLISNIFIEDVKRLFKTRPVLIRVGKYQIKDFSETFRSGGGRSLQAYPDSSGFVGFSIFQKNAAEETGLKKGDLVEIF